MLAFAHEDA
jgi:hypothetical protein